MNEFEKWWESAIVDINATHKDTVKLGWNAALECVLNECRGTRSLELYDLLSKIYKEFYGKTS